MKKGVVLLFLVIIILIPFVYATDINSCQTLAGDDSYFLTQNVSTTAGCFDVNSFTGNNILLDCQGFTAFGDGGFAEIGFQASLRNNITIRNCNFNGFYWGISLDSGATNLVAYNNTIYNVTGDGFRISNVNININVTSNTVDSPDFGGATVSNVLNLTFFNNTIMNTAVWASIDLNNVNNSLFDNNNLVNSSVHGFWVGSSGGSCNNNNFTNNIFDSDLSYSTVGNPNSANFYLDVSVDSRFENNTMNKSGQAGFRIINNDINNTIVSNVIINSSKAGIYSSGGGSGNVIDGNNITYHTRGLAAGIYLSSISDQNQFNITNNLNIGNNTYGVYLTNANATNLTGNTIAFNGNTGIFLTNSHNTTINSNTLNNNTRDGIGLVALSSDNVISSNTVYLNSNIGINITNSTNNSAFSNSVYNHTAGAAAGFYIRDVNAVNYIYDNLVVENNTYGTYSRDANFTNFTGNVFTGNRDGLYFHFFTHNLIIYNNTLTGTSVGYPLHVGLSDNATVENNNISFNSVYVLLDDSNNALLINNTFEGNGALETPDAIFIDNDCNNFTFVNNSLINNLYNGLWVDGNGSIYGNVFSGNDNIGLYVERSAQNLSIYSNNFTNHTLNTAAGIYFSDLGNAWINVSTNLNITNNTYGILINNSDNKYLENNIITSGVYGVYVYDSDNTTFISNTLNSNTNTGIYLNSTNNTVVTSNTANSNTQDGIYITDNFNVTLNSNTLNLNLDNGLNISDSDNLTFNSNTLTYNSQGVYSINTNNSFYQSNTINHSTGIGITFASSYNNDLSSNTLFNNSASGISMSTSSNNNNIYSNTIFNGTNGQGIEIYSSNNNSIYNNPSLNGNVYGLYLEDSLNMNVTNNTFNFNLAAGLYIDNTTTTLDITSNVANNNTQYGYQIISSQNNFTNSNASGNGAIQYYFDGANVTFLDRVYVTNLPSTSSVLNITNGGIVNTLNYDIIETDYLNFTFNNATNLSFFATNDLTNQGVSATTCSNTSEICDIASNLLVMNNLSINGSVNNLTIYYNSSDLNSTFNESNLTVARYSNGWSSLSNTFEINTTAQFVRLIGDLTSFSPWAAVTFDAAPSSGSSGSTSGTSGGGSPGNTGAPDRSNNNQNQQQEAGEPGETQTTNVNSQVGQTNTVTNTFSNGVTSTLTFNTNTDSSGSVVVTMNTGSSGVPNGRRPFFEVIFRGNFTNETLEFPIDLRFEVPLQELGITSDELDDWDIYILKIHDNDQRVRLQTHTELDSARDLLIITAKTKKQKM
ncbi:right-handed parallel beta-helix repeat-containing protein [Candidatus Woesearchaeota archaeon]|nr:right-handed parallel beta-helix repeat-containing protein [Candidatus Woesearchaeota archaeon]